MSTGLKTSFIHSFIPKRQILDCSKSKEFADDDFKFDERGRKLLSRVENTVGKGETACYEFVWTVTSVCMDFKIICLNCSP